MASSGRHFEQGLQLPKESESEYSPDSQALQVTGTFFGILPPQGTVAPCPGGHFGHGTQICLPCESFIKR